MKYVILGMCLIAIQASANPIAEANAAWDKAATTAKWGAINSCAAAKDAEAQRACYGAVERMSRDDVLAQIKPGNSPAPQLQQVVSTTPTTPAGWIAHGAGQLLGGIWDFGKAAALNLGPAYLNARVGMRQAQANEVVAGFARDQHVATMGAFTSTAQAGFTANTQIAGFIQAPQPNITNTLSGTGVLGSGSYIGPVTRNCNGGVAAAGGSATGTTGTASGGAGAPANGGNC